MMPHFKQLAHSLKSLASSVGDRLADEVQASSVPFLDIGVMVFALTFLSLACFALLRYWQWYHVQPADHEWLQTDAEGAAGQSRGEEQTPLVQPPSASAPMPKPTKPSRLQNALDFFKASAVLTATAICLSGAATSALLAGSVFLSSAFDEEEWQGSDNAEDNALNDNVVSALSFAAAGILSMMFVAVVALVLRASVLALMEEKKLGAHCYCGALTEEYRLRVTRTFRKDLLSRAIDTLDAATARVTAIRAGVMSRRWIITVQVMTKRAAFLFDIGSDVVVAKQLLLHHPRAGALSCFFLMLPYIGLALFLGGKQVRRAAIALHPSLARLECGRLDALWVLALPLMDVSMMIQYFNKQPKANTLSHFMTARSLAEVYLEANFQVLLQGYLLLRQANPFGLLPEYPHTSVKGWALLVSVASSAMTSKEGIDLLGRLASWQTKGNVTTFVTKMRSLGDGLAPSSLLVALFERREVTLVEDQMAGVNIAGFDSIVRAIVTSKALTQVTLPGEFLSKLLDEDKANRLEYIVIPLLLKEGSLHLSTLTIAGTSSQRLAEVMKKYFGYAVPRHSRLSVELLHVQGSNDDGSGTGTAPPSTPTANLPNQDVLISWSSLDRDSSQVLVDADGNFEGLRELLLLHSFPASSTFSSPSPAADSAAAEERERRRGQHQAARSAVREKCEEFFKCDARSRRGCQLALLHFGLPGLLPGPTHEKEYDSGALALMRAAGEGRQEPLALLLETKEVDVSWLNPQTGSFPLQVASQNGHEKCVELLLKVGKADANQLNPQNGAFPLLMASENGHEKCVELLLKVGKADASQLNPQNGTFPLLMASQNGHEKCVELLLKVGKADANQVDPQTGTFPLLMASCNGHEKCVELLLKVGKADASQLHAQTGTFPLLMASQAGHEKCIARLLEARANVHRTWQHPEDAAVTFTPLSLARENGHEACVELLARGATES